MICGRNRPIRNRPTDPGIVSNVPGGPSTYNRCYKLFMKLMHHLERRLSKDGSIRSQTFTLLARESTFLTNLLDEANSKQEESKEGNRV